MRMKSIPRIAGCLVSCVALSATVVAGEELSGATLQNKIKSIRYSDTCARMVAPEHTSSYPLPILVNKAQTFRVLFYSVVTVPAQQGAKGDVRPPVAIGRFDAGSDGTCEAYPMPMGVGVSSPALGPRWPVGVRELTMDQFARQQRTLFSVLAQAASGYFSGSTGARSQILAQEFLDRFEKMSEPGLRPYYRSLSPDFWQWIQDRTGKTF